MQEDELRRMALTVGAAVLLAGVDAPTPRQVNRAVEVAAQVDKAVRQRLRWEDGQRRDRAAEGVPS